MKYKENGELKNYRYWVQQQKEITVPNFNLFLTGVGGVIYPPDIFQIKKEYLTIIKETITNDDFTLKYLETIKGIEERWINNSHPQGLRIKKNSIHKPLYRVNSINNDKYIKNINIVIENSFLKNLCVNYKNVKTGLIIYLFNINNIHYENDNLTNFDIEAYSFCPIDNNIKFKIIFGKNIANCKFDYSHSIIRENLDIYKTSKILKASCLINRKIKNINDFNFPKAIFQKNLTNRTIKIYNYHKYIPIVFTHFYKNIVLYKYLNISKYNNNYRRLIQKHIS